MSECQTTVDAPPTTGRDPTWWARVSGAACIHATGVVITAAAVAWVAIGMDHLRWIVTIHQDWASTSLVAQELMIHGVLSVLLWLSIFGIVCGMGRTHRSQRGLARARGTVLTETLIVMPVLLLLILGTAQLAVNNIARMLINYGTSQAARAAWVWQPEVAPLGGAEGRMGVDDQWVEDMARLRVAAAMTPVAPAAFAANRNITDDSFEKARAMFLAAQVRNPTDDAGGDVLADAQILDAFEEADELTFKNALDGGSFPRRTIRKFTSAYEAADVTVSERSVDEVDYVSVEVEYLHQITFPLMGSVFGESATVGQTRSRFLRIEREMIYRAQRPPNAALPAATP